MGVTKKLTLNTNYEFLIRNFSRNTYNQDGRLVSTIYVALDNPSSQAIEQLRSLAMYSITDFVVEVGEETVYQLHEVEAKINSIEESLGDDGVMMTSFSMSL